MSTYVIADIHGCYREFMQLLERVKFNDKTDRMYVLGDIIDRGPGSQQVFDWVYARKDKNVRMCKGNHEDLFCQFVDFYDMQQKVFKIMKRCRLESLDISWILTSDMKAEDKELLLEYYNSLSQDIAQAYDKYGTIGQLLSEGKSMRYIHKMKSFFEELPYYFKVRKKGKTFYLVHAYISEPVSQCDRHEMIWSRAYPDGEPGIPGKVIIYGHTPTVNHRYNGAGGVIVDKQNGAVTVNIDCGCCWRTENSRLALLRLDDMKIYYSNIYRYNYVPNVE